jgi:NAD(P)H-hydrate epimerase
VPRLPPRPRDGHKGTFGTVLLLAGSDGMLGAAILAARAALRGGAGLVRVAVPAALQSPLAIAVPGATSLPRTWPRVQRELPRADAIVIGPGLAASAATRRLVLHVLAHATSPVVVDADALNVLAPWPRRGAPRPRRAAWLWTPHPGEAGRLLGISAAAVQRDRAAALRTLQQRSGAIVVLKGQHTLVGDGRQSFLNRTGNPGLGTGGSGDVLAGLLGALLAQGMAPFAAACLAVHAHGAAADRLARRVGEVGLVAEDLPLAIAEVLRGKVRR